MDFELITKMKISAKPKEIFDAFIEPEKIGKFWFSSSSEKWTKASKIKLVFDEYHAEVEIKIVDIIENEKIVFSWGEKLEERTVAISIKNFDGTSSVVEVNETGWKDNDELINNLLGNKEGWVFMLTCLKAYLENGVSTLRTGVVI